MRTKRSLAVVALACAAALAACGEDSGGSTESETPRIAFFNPSAANTYISQTWGRMEKIAKQRGAELTQFDAAFDPAKQQQQLQTATASNKYDGIIISPIGAQLTADVQAAAAAGLEVVVVGNILGPKLDTSDPQVEGVDLSVLSPPTGWGQGLGDLTLQACEGKDPCRVVYFYGLKGTPGDTAFFKGFEETIATNDAIEVVATGEGKYQGPDVALAAMQNILQSTPEFDVVVGADQSMQGVQLALEQAGKLEDVAIIGLGGSSTALERIKGGKWYGGVMTAPQTEGEIAINGMLDLLESGRIDTPTGVDPLTRLPHRGIITRENADQFEPQWKG